MSRENLNGYKSKGTIPYEALLTFASAEGLTADFIFYGKEAEKAEDKTNRAFDEQSKRLDLLQDVNKKLMKEQEDLWGRFNALQDKVDNMNARMIRAAEEKDIELLGILGGSAS